MGGKNKEKFFNEERKKQGRKGKREKEIENGKKNGGGERGKRVSFRKRRKEGRQIFRVWRKKGEKTVE